MGEKKPDNDAVRKKHGDMPRCLLRCADECAWPIQGLASWAISEHRPEMTSQAYMVAKWASLKRISTNTSPPGIARCGGSHDGTPRPPRPPKFRFVCCFWKTPPNPEKSNPEHRQDAGVSTKARSPSSDDPSCHQLVPLGAGSSSLLAAQARKFRFARKATLRSVASMAWGLKRRARAHFVCRI